MPLKVSVVILNFNRPQDTLECVHSVLESDYPFFEILVVDNDSHDNSAAIFLEQLPDIALLKNSKNFGYAGGNNAGIRQALKQGADYVFVLNNDAVVNPDTIRLLVETGEERPEATLIAPKVNEYARRNVVNSFGTSMDWFRLRPFRGDYGQEDDGRFESIKEAEIIPGAAFLMKRRLFEETGLFDESFFLIHEDADLCLRNLKAGFKNVVVPQALVYHKISKTLSAYPEASEYYSVRNFLSLAKFHAAPLEKGKVAVGLALLSLKKLAQYPFMPAQRAKIRAFFSGVGDYFKGRSGPFSPPHKALDKFL